MAKISMIGSGHVGSAVGKGFKELGNEVIFCDIDQSRVDQLRKEGFDATTDFDHAIKNSDVSFIAVPTPTTDKRIDLSYIKSAAESIARSLKNKNRFHVVVIKSTVVPTTTEDVVKPILEKFSGKICGVDFGLCVNPEFLTEIHHTWTDDKSAARGFFTEERVVIGESDKKSGDVLEKLYKPLNIPIFRVSMIDAELIKYLSNAALLSRLSYWNEVFLLCKRFNVDAQKLANIICLDKRIGTYGSVLGLAAGGKCLEKDLQALVTFLKEHNIKSDLLQAVLGINVYMAKKYGRREKSLE